MTRDMIVVDASHYQNKINPAELVDGGAERVILNMYDGTTLDDKFRQHAEAILTDGRLGLDVYNWDDPILSSERQVDCWLRGAEAYPEIGAMFPDVEQWWSSWGDWWKAVQKEIEWALVARFNPLKLSWHYERTAVYLRVNWAKKMAVYTSRGFVRSYAPDISRWIGLYDLWTADYRKQVKRGTVLTWEQFKAAWLPDYDPLFPDGAREPIGHQFTGDCALLPGTYTWKDTYSAADVSMFDRTWYGAQPPPVVPPVWPTLEERVARLEAEARGRGWAV